MHLPDASTLGLTSLVQNAAMLTIVLAFAGYLVTFMSTRMLARRQDKLVIIYLTEVTFFAILLSS